MRRLLGVELTRLRWRRAILLLGVVAVAATVLTFGLTAWNTRPYSEAEKAQFERNLARDSADAEQSIRDCVAHPEEQGIPEGEDPQEICEQWYQPTMAWYGGREELDLVNERQNGSGPGVIALVSIAVMLAGTTFAGHDWATGSMSNQLLFDPRRLRVWGAKGVVVTLAGLVFAGVVLSAYWTGLWGVATARGLDPSTHDLGEGFQQALRGSLLAALGGLIAYALTMLFRSTVATLGVFFGLSILTPILLSIVYLDDAERWMPHNNVAAVVLDGTTYWVDDGMVEQHLSLAGGATYLLVLLALAVVPSALSFRRRDVP